MDQFSGSGIGVLMVFFGARCFVALPITGTSSERSAILVLSRIWSAQAPFLSPPQLHRTSFLFSRLPHFLLVQFVQQSIVKIIKRFFPTDGQKVLYL